MQSDDDNSSCSSGSEIGAFATLDLTGVDFDKGNAENEDDGLFGKISKAPEGKKYLQWEQDLLWDAMHTVFARKDDIDCEQVYEDRTVGQDTCTTKQCNRIRQLKEWIEAGQYIMALCSDSAKMIFSLSTEDCDGQGRRPS